MAANVYICILYPYTHPHTHTHTLTQAIDNDQLPPPIPLKQKHRYSNTASSPQQTPTHSHSVSSPVSMLPTHGAAGYFTAESLARSFGTNSYHRGSGSSDGTDGGDQEKPPCIPMRMESIPGMKSALTLDTPPPKPPRTDIPNTVSQVQNRLMYMVITDMWQNWLEFIFKLTTLTNL